MLIPYAELASETLQAIILEFVTRDGTDHSSIDQRVASVMKQLENGEVELHFEVETESCNIVRATDAG